MEQDGWPRLLAAAFWIQMQVNPVGKVAVGRMLWEAGEFFPISRFHRQNRFASGTTTDTSPELPRHVANFQPLFFWLHVFKIVMAVSAGFSMILWHLGWLRST